MYGKDFNGRFITNLHIPINIVCLNKGMHSSILFIVSLLILNTNSTQKSPCPKYLTFEPDKAEEDRWYGLITLTSQTDVKNVVLELHFNKPVTQLGNWFGRVQPSSTNTVFQVRNKKYIVKANTPTKIEFFVVFDPYYDIPAPQLTMILFNGREICPREDAQLTHDMPAITINIKLPSCGIKTINPTPLITHGEHTVEGEWPWHAALYRLEGRKKIYICGGTLISEKHILTAAHCTTVIQDNMLVGRDPNSVSIVLGKYGTYVYGQHEQTMDVSSIVYHHNFNTSNLHNDISIIVMVDPAKFTDYVRPICLWEEGIGEDAVVDHIGTVVGWGREENNNEITDLLMEAKLPVVSRLKCILAQGSYYSKFTNDKTLCAGFRNGTSVCNGDSGGGLIFPKTGTSGIDTVWQIRGIVSNAMAKTGNVCDPDYYVVFTDVAKYLDWINDIIK